MRGLDGARGGQRTTTRRRELEGVGHGSVLAGRYRLEERVRTRADGSTWRAVDETLERPVLVRVFRSDHPYGAEIVDAARRAALVADPRLQRVLAAGEERGTAYVVLERVPGRSLAELLAVGPLPAETARRVVGEAAQALDRASTRGLHHLRLRPTSLIVGQDGIVTVSGTAIDAAAQGADAAGSLLARRADAVGLVSLLYAALTGRWPAQEPAGLPAAPRVAGRPVGPGDLVAGVPNDLDTLCSVTLGPYDDGPRSPGDLAADLAPWAPPGPLSDPRGLQLSASRPQPRPRRVEVPAASLGVQTAEPRTPPAEPRTPEPPTRRTPASGLRARTRSQVQQAQAARADEHSAVRARSDLRSPLDRRAPSAPLTATTPPLAPSTPGSGWPLAATPAPAGTPLLLSPTPASPPAETTPTPERTAEQSGEPTTEPVELSPSPPTAPAVRRPALRHWAERGAPTRRGPVRGAGGPDDGPGTACPSCRRSPRDPTRLTARTTSRTGRPPRRAARRVLHARRATRRHGSDPTPRAAGPAGA